MIFEREPIVGLNFALRYICGEALNSYGNDALRFYIWSRVPIQRRLLPLMRLIPAHKTCGTGGAAFAQGD